MEKEFMWVIIKKGKFKTDKRKYCKEGCIFML